MITAHRARDREKKNRWNHMYVLCIYLYKHKYTQISRKCSSTDNDSRYLKRTEAQNAYAGNYFNGKCQQEFISR